MPQGPMPGVGLSLTQPMMLPRMTPNSSPGYPLSGLPHEMSKLTAIVGGRLTMLHVCCLTDYRPPPAGPPPGPGGLVRSIPMPNHGQGIEYIDYSAAGGAGRLGADSRPPSAHPLYTPSLKYALMTPVLMPPSHLLPPPSPSLSRPPQPWHQVVTSEVRSHLIKKL